jgi:DNA polymerase-3 subunit beta
MAFLINCSFTKYSEIGGGLMKFKVSRTEFFKALQKVIGVIPARATIEVLTNVLVYTENNRLHLLGSDLELTMISSADAEIEEEGGIAIPSKILNEIIRELPEEDLYFSVNHEDNIVTLKSSKGHYTIKAQPKKIFPSLPEIPGKNEIRVPNQVAKRMIEKTAFATSGDDLRPALTGVLFQFTPSYIQMVATDGHRLAKIKNTSVHFGDGENQMILPTKTLQAVLKNLESEEYHTLIFDENWIVFNLSSVLIYSRLINENYPDYERAIPTNNTKELFVSTSELTSSIKRVSLFSNSITNQIRVSLLENNINISAEDFEVGGEGAEEISCNYSHDAMEIGYNANYLLDVVRHIDTDEVKFMLDTPISGGLVFPDKQNDDEEFVMLIMPVRLTER